MLALRIGADTGIRRFYADGQNVSLLDETMLLYATVPMPGTIDDMIDTLDDTYGFVPPLADFAANNPYERFRRQIHTSVYHSKETIDRCEASHLTAVASRRSITVNLDRSRPIDRATSHLRHSGHAVEGARLRAYCVQPGVAAPVSAPESFFRRSSSERQGPRHS